MAASLRTACPCPPLVRSCRHSRRSALSYGASARRLPSHPDLKRCRASSLAMAMQWEAAAVCRRRAATSRRSRRECTSPGGRGPGACARNLAVKSAARDASRIYSECTYWTRFAPRHWGSSAALRHLGKIEKRCARGARSRRLGRRGGPALGAGEGGRAAGRSCTPAPLRRRFRLSAQSCVLLLRRAGMSSTLEAA